MEAVSLKETSKVENLEVSNRTKETVHKFLNKLRQYRDVKDIIEFNSYSATPNGTVLLESEKGFKYLSVEIETGKVTYFVEVAGQDIAYESALDVHTLTKNKLVKINQFLNKINEN